MYQHFSLIEGAEEYFSRSLWLAGGRYDAIALDDNDDSEVE